MKATRPGLSELNKYFSSKLKGLSLGVLCHPASVDHELTHCLNFLEEKKAKIKAIFGPQHGIYGETQDNMIEWQDFEDTQGRKIYSLYGKNRKPTDESLEGVKTVIVDLQDVGARYYTFVYTLFYMMEACSKHSISVVVCDRPNPIGGNLIEGPLLNLHFKSFVGLHPLPIRHGMTIGEIALFFNSRLEKPVDLKILKMKNWKRSQHWPETGLTFVPPSPNIPTYETCLVYPGMCLLEATNLSEGRGTTRPFELIGAPFIDWALIEKDYQKLCKKFGLSPVYFHRQGFIPTFHKHAGSVCHGVLQICKQPKKFSPVRSATILLWLLKKHYKTSWDWSKPPYEYEYEKWPIDILSGDSRLRECVDSQGSLEKLFSLWKKDEKAFQKTRKSFLLYS